MQRPVGEVIAANVKRLLEAQHGVFGPRERSGVARLIRLGIPNGNAARLMRGEDVQLSTLLEVARVLRVSAQDLLCTLDDSGQSRTDANSDEALLLSAFRALPDGHPARGRAIGYVTALAETIGSGESLTLHAPPSPKYANGCR